MTKKKEIDIFANENKIGLVQLKKDTSENDWRAIEEFFIAKKLFISSVPKGIMVLDVDKAKKLIMEMMK